MERYKELKEMLKEELENIQNKGELNMQTLEQTDKLAHALKCLCGVEAMEQGGYSQRSSYDGGSYGYDSYGYDSYARGRGRNARRDSMGRYSSELSRDSYDDMESSYRRR